MITGLIYAKNDNIDKSKFNKYLTIITVVILLLIGFTSGILTILFQMVKIYPEDQEKNENLKNIDNSNNKKFSFLFMIYNNI